MTWKTGRFKVNSTHLNTSNDYAIYYLSLHDKQRTGLGQRLKLPRHCTFPFNHSETVLLREYLPRLPTTSVIDVSIVMCLAGVVFDTLTYLEHILNVCLEKSYRFSSYKFVSDNCSMNTKLFRSCDEILLRFLSIHKIL